MDLRVNGIGFQGKKEIMYGLKKSANLAKTLEYTHKAYVTSRMAMTKYEERTAYNASMRAYMDMVTKDSEFVEVVNNKLGSKDINELKEILKPEQVQHGKIQPFNVFSETIKDVADKNHSSKNVKQVIEKLCEALSI